jgi:small subunit ribosomal protein S6
MLRYEILMLSVPEITQDEVKQLENRLEKLVEQYKGSLLSFERWGKYRLAYPVKKNDYGVYFLLRFEIKQDPTALLNEIKTIFAVKLNDIIMRHLVSRLDADASLAYQRPQSLEDAPAKDVDTFLREHKVEGLTSKETRRGHHRPEGKYAQMDDLDMVDSDARA